MGSICLQFNILSLFKAFFIYFVLCFPLEQVKKNYNYYFIFCQFWNKFYICSLKSGNSSVGRARPCQGRGREFESRFPLSTQNN